MFDRTPLSAFSLTLGLSLALIPAAGAQEQRPFPKVPNFGFGVEAGMNGMTGITGVTLTYWPMDRLAVDAGLGVGALGAAVGTGVRGYMLETRHIHPFTGVAYRYTSGADQFTMMLDEGANGERHYDFQAAIDPSHFVNLQAGIEFRWGPFQLRPALGWSQKIVGGDWHVLSGTAPTGADADPVNIILGSGPSVTVNTGFAF